MGLAGRDASCCKITGKGGGGFVVVERFCFLLAFVAMDLGEFVD